MNCLLHVRSLMSASALVLLLGAFPARAIEPTITVGTQPLSIVPVGEKVHVFHNQVDANFNGVQEDGDSPASWWVLDKSGAVLTTKNFEWGFTGYPFRPYVDAVAKSVYISHLGRVRKFSLDNQSLETDTVVALNAAGIATMGDYVYVSVRPDFSNPGSLVVHNMVTGNEQSRQVGVNPQQIVPFKTSDGVEGVLVLSEGVFGGSTPSMLDKYVPGSDVIFPQLEIGALGNYIAVQGDSAFVAMNGTYDIAVVDLKNWTVVKFIPVSTADGNGPRELVVSGDNLFVSTFDNDVRMISISSSAELRRFQPGGRPEGIALIDNKLWVTNAFKASSFQSDNTIAIWDFTTTSVADGSDARRPTVAPSIVRDEAVITVPFFSPVRIEIVSALGVPVGEISNGNASNGVYTAHFVPAQYNLAAGRYFLRISAGSVVRTVPVAVVR